MKVAKKPKTHDPETIKAIKKGLKRLKVRDEEDNIIARASMSEKHSSSTSLTIKIPIQRLKIFVKHFNDTHGLDYINIKYSTWNAGVETRGKPTHFLVSIKGSMSDKFAERLLNVTGVLKKKGRL